MRCVEWAVVEKAIQRGRIGNRELMPSFWAATLLLRENKFMEFCFRRREHVRSSPFFRETDLKLR